MLPCVFGIEGGFAAALMRILAKFPLGVLTEASGVQ
jgi:hypothetical protein